MRTFLIAVAVTTILSVGFFVLGTRQGWELPYLLQVSIGGVFGCVGAAVGIGMDR